MRPFTFDRPRHDRRFAPYGFVVAWGILAAIGGLALAASEMPALLREREEKAWPAARGRVVWSQTAPYRTPEGEQFMRRRVAYAYETGGREYSGQWTELLPRSAWAEAARSETRGTRQPTAANVHFDPADPSRSWVYREPVPLDTLIVGLVTVACGLLVAGVAWKLRQAENPLATREGGEVIAPPDGPRRWEIPALLSI